MTGQTISHYKILQKVGSGGMGVVYKAEDTKLNRVVAIKFLAPSLTDDAVLKQRFMQEARAASALDQQNICTVHEIDETADGQLFLVMAYYEGETLTGKIKYGALPLEEALDIARQILFGLARAHESKIVHRDLKPSNIIITRRNEVKILDFGLARLIGGVDLTPTGGLMGTVPYVSPEQALGRNVDYRSDLWSVGIILYEMLTGQRPFQGSTAHAILSSIIYEEGKSVRAQRANLPPALDQVIQRALEKDPKLRYQSAQEFMRDIDFVWPSSQEGITLSVWQPFPPPREPSLLVLPFVNLPPAKETDYFSDGLTEEIIADLSGIRSLRVISRGSIMRLKGQLEDNERTIRELRVRYILEGSVRRSEDNLRVTVKLIDATTDSLLWADKYTGGLQDTFSIQETVSRGIAEALKLKLSREEKQKLAERPIADIRAYEYYLKARQEILSFSKQALERALDYLQSGLKIVGENILLLSALGQVYWQFVNAGISSDPSYLEKARAYAERILTLDPDSPHGHRLLGLIQAHQGKTQEAVRCLKQALNKDPNDPDTLGWLVVIYGFSGKPYAAAPLAKRLLEIDPLTPSCQYLPGLLALMAGEFRRALAPFLQAFKMEPNNPLIRLCYGQILALNGRLDESVQVFDALVNDMPESLFAHMGVFYKHALQTNRARVLQEVTAELESLVAADPYYCWNFAECYALIKEKEQAVAWLQNGVKLGFINYPLLSRLDPFLENIRGERAFDLLMEKVREHWEAFEV